MPLWKWLLATYLLCESRRRVSVNQIKRTLRISYKTAWQLRHRIRAAISETRLRPLSDTIVDEAYLSGRQRHSGKPYYQVQERIVLGVCQRCGGLNFFPVQDVGARALHRYIPEDIREMLIVLSCDGFSAYEVALQNRRREKKLAPIDHRKHDYVYPDINLNWVKAEISRRKNLYLFRDALLYLIHAAPNA
ncbi:MAG TPA: IS1595 family transposase [Terriglobales bacterium]|nr:IS1595 family transposase [Terriglobales bacterium]